MGDLILDGLEWGDLEAYENGAYCNHIRCKHRHPRGMGAWDPCPSCCEAYKFHSYLIENGFVIVRTRKAAEKVSFAKRVGRFDDAHWVENYGGCRRDQIKQVDLLDEAEAKDLLQEYWSLVSGLLKKEKEGGGGHELRNDRP